MSYRSKNQLAKMIEHRAKALYALQAELGYLVDAPSRAAVLQMDKALETLESVQGLLRGGLDPSDLKSEAQAAAEAHRPGLPPGGGQPDLF